LYPLRQLDSAHLDEEHCRLYPEEMKIIIFGLSISSAWGNGHATLLRGLFRALHSERHEVHFFEQDKPYYSSHRDADCFSFAALHLYSDWFDARFDMIRQLERADAAIVTSYCPDGIRASRLVTKSKVPRKVFYDMDTPVTLARLEKGERIEYLPPEGLAAFDLVLSYTGGEALTQLRQKLHARCVSALYGWVDPESYHTADPVPEFRADLSYLGTYAPDRQSALENLLIYPAALMPNRRFVIAGAMFPQLRDTPANVTKLEHLPPPQHPAFFSSSRITLNVTRAPMAAMGYCPSGRLFEAAACGTPVLSDWWPGLDEFFLPGDEILIAASTTDSIRAVSEDSSVLKRIGSRAKQRVLDCHTASIRARQLIDLIEFPKNERTSIEGNVHRGKEI